MRTIPHRSASRDAAARQVADSPAAATPEAELEELRARNAELEAASRRVPIGTRLKRIGRSFAATLLILLGVICLTVSVPAIWGRNLLLNTDRYVQTVQPLASNPGVQQVVISRVDDQITSRIDIKALIADSGLPPRASALGPPLQNAVDSVVNKATTTFVQSAAFERIWVNANRAAHRQIDYVLTGDRPNNSALQVSNTGVVSVDVSAVVNRVKQRLVAQGLSAAAKIPNVNTTIEIAHLKNLQKTRDTVKVFNTLANWLPWIGLALIAGGIAAARHRRRTLLISAVSVGAGMVVLGIGLMIVRHFYLSAIPPDKLPQSTAESIFDTLVRYMRDGLRLVLLVALLVALGAWLAGPSTPAVAIRRRVAGIPRWVRERGATRSWPSERVSGFVQQYRNQLRGAVIGLGLIVLILWDNPGLAVIITLAVIAALLLLVVEAMRAGAARQKEA
jgi:hypothetical protein